MEEGAEEKQKPILIFDQECQLCVRFKQGLDYLDKQELVRKVPLQEEWLYQTYPQLSKDECEATIHLLDESGNVHKGPEVVEFLVKFYPGIKKFAWLVESERGKKTVEFFYDKVNELREKVKKNCKNCGGRRR